MSSGTCWTELRREDFLGEADATPRGASAGLAEFHECTPAQLRPRRACFAGREASRHRSYWSPARPLPHPLYVPRIGGVVKGFGEACTAAAAAGPPRPGEDAGAALHLQRLPCRCTRSDARRAARSGAGTYRASSCGPGPGGDGSHQRVGIWSRPSR